MKTSIGEFLLLRLEQAGIQHIFGVPGDFNLEFMQQLEDRGQPAWVGNCNELNASYAADGYARIAGLSALIVTHGVGALSALNGIAGAYSEHVPVICICGSLPLRSSSQGLLMHHTLADGNRDNVLQAFRPFTVAQAQLTPQNAVPEIDRMILSAWQTKRPVYMELPSDIACLEIEVSDDPFVLLDPMPDAKSVDACAARIIERLEAAKAPAIILDLDADRFHVLKFIEDLATKLQIPVATVGTTKGCFPEQSPLFAGLYAGAASSPELRKIIEQSDCLLAFGYRRVDAVSGFFTDSIPADAIHLNPYSADILSEHFEGVSLRSVLLAVLQGVKPTNKVLRIEKARSEVRPTREGKLTQLQYWDALQSFLRPDDIIIAEDGTSSSGSGKLSLPQGCTYITQAVWGSIGYSVGATLGALCAAPERRTILLVGDGSFQLTAQEVSTMLRHDLKPWIFLINNGGYTIERTILGKTAKYNDIANWKYSELPRVFSDREVDSRVIWSADELAVALQEDLPTLRFFELVMAPDDAPIGLIKGGHASADLDYGLRGPQHRPGAQIPIPGS